LLSVLSVPSVFLLSTVATPATAQTARPLAQTQGLEPGDLVRLKIWREPDLSGDFRVDEKSMVVFPKIGTVDVSRLAVDSLHALLVSSYSRYLQNASVDVTFLRRIDILGEVKTPGLYHVDPTMTLPDVLAMAGGVTPDGDANKIQLIRRGNKELVHLAQGISLVDSTLRSGDQLRVPQRSWVSRNSAAVLGAVITGGALVLAAVLRP
jgi:polysaccharide export outer membrane protein